MLFKKQVAHYFYVFLLASLGGCTTISKPPLEDMGTNMASGFSKPQRLQSWSAQGSLAVQTAQKGSSASFYWVQERNGNYRLAIFGPLGANSILLIGNPQYATLDAAGKTESAPNAEELLEHRLGWYIPVTNIYYWGRGLPAKGHGVHEIFYNEKGQIASMVQQGWKITYQQYNNLGLPTHIELKNPKLFIRIAIRQWNF